MYIMHVCTTVQQTVMRSSSQAACTLIRHEYAVRTSRITRDQTSAAGRAAERTSLPWWNMSAIMRLRMVSTPVVEPSVTPMKMEWKMMPASSV